MPTMIIGVEMPVIRLLRWWPSCEVERDLGEKGFDVEGLAQGGIRGAEALALPSNRGTRRHRDHGRLPS